MYWQTGRQAVPPDAPDSEAIDQRIGRLGIAYLLIDDDRYANAALNPLSRYVRRFPDHVALVWEGNQSVAPVRVFAVRRGD